MQDKHWKGFARALDRLDLLELERFRTAEMRELNKNERIDITQEVLRPFKSKEIIERLEREDVPCAPVHTRRDMRLHPQVVANGTVVETDHPQAGRLRQARHPAQFSKTAASIRRGAPALGEHTRDVLLESGFSHDEVAILEGSGAIWQAASASTS